MSALMIRAALPKDLPDVRNVLIETWHAAYDHILGEDEVTQITNSWHSVEALREHLEKPDSYFSVGEMDEIVGTTYSIFNHSSNVIELSRLYVLPSAQGHGIGSSLLKNIYEQFPESHAIELEVMKDNIPSILFYERQGFVVTGTGDDCGVAGSGIKHMIMRKSLKT